MPVRRVSATRTTWKPSSPGLFAHGRHTLAVAARRYVASFDGCRAPRVALVCGTAVYGAALLVAILMLRAPLYIGLDSVQSYAHVEYLAHVITTDHRLPLRMSGLEGGQAIAIPYAALPWLPDAVLRPIAGDRIVTLSMIGGAALLVAGWLYFRPALRQPALVALALANPYFWDGLTQFQIATFWSFALFLMGAGLFERGRPLAATVLFAGAFAVHPLMGGGALAFFVVVRAIRDRHGVLPLFASEAVALAIASPFAVLFLSAPVAQDTSARVLAVSAIDDLQRLALIALPMLIARYPAGATRLAAPLMAGGLAITAAWSWAVPPRGLWDAPGGRFDAYLAAHPIEVSGRTYRVMTGAYHEDGMLDFLRAGAVLSGEFFTESEHRVSFASEGDYICFLKVRRVGYVVLEGAYLREFGTNEGVMAEQLAADGVAEVQYRGNDRTVAYRIAEAELARRKEDCR